MGYFTIKLRNGPLYNNVVMLRTEVCKSKNIFKSTYTRMVVSLIIDGEPYDVVWNAGDIEYVISN